MLHDLSSIWAEWEAEKKGYLLGSREGGGSKFGCCLCRERKCALVLDKFRVNKL